MKAIQAQFQIGKNGLTPGVLQSLELALKGHSQVRISILKSSTRDRKQIEELAQEIQSRLPQKTNYRIIGFTIILKKLKHKV